MVKPPPPNSAAARLDQTLLDNCWSDLRRYRDMPEIDHARMHAYRRNRLKAELEKADIGVLVLTNPISLRYAVDYAVYALFQSHIPEAYLFVNREGPWVMHGAVNELPAALAEARPPRALAYFDAGDQQAEASRLLADDLVEHLKRLGSDNRRVALEYTNPSLTQALIQRGLDVIDGTPIAEAARVIKSADEIACIRWALAVAEHGMEKMQQMLHPGITELQLWGLLNYTNLANHGDWHDGRMLASGPRTNPWMQEASQRQIEAGDIVAFDTDMVGPFGYFADISRSFFCGPAQPTKRQKQLYRLAHEEVETNLKLIRPGISFFDIQDQAYDVPEEFRQQAYACIMHAVGMCDEYPRINYGFRGRNFYNGTLEAGMVICVESYMGAVGETNGVKLEQQALVTDDGYELLSSYPYEEKFLD